MDHEEVARHIIKGRNTALVPKNAEYLIGEIAEALQNAFDLGFQGCGRASCCSWRCQQFIKHAGDVDALDAALSNQQLEANKKTPGL